MTWSDFLLYFSVALLITVSIFLVLLVLIQKGRGGGLASAFGGGGGNTAFGSKTGDVLTWATSIVFGIFLVLAVVTNVTANHIHNAYKKTVAEQEQQQPAPVPASESPANNPLSAPANTDVPVAPRVPASQPSH